MIAGTMVKRGNNRGWFEGKRAVSPLIATILLIAFAVALGAVVMSIGRTIPCPVNLEVVELGGVAAPCLRAQGNDTFIEFTIKNLADADVEDLHLIAFGANDVMNSPYLLETPLTKSTAQKIRVKYNINQYGPVDKIEITPEIICKGESQTQESSALSFENIGTCPG
jgi:flagellin-like protein